jgi:uncharacterized protein (DUF2141 family)
MKRIFPAIVAAMLIPAVPREVFPEEHVINRDNYGDIIVKVAGIRSAEGGKLIVSLYTSRESWLKIKEAWITEVIAVDSDSTEVLFKQVPFDSVYAVAVIHDKNENGKLDMRKFPWPKPKEGVGVSNNKFGFGPPNYDDAVLDLSVPVLKIGIGLIY